MFAGSFDESYIANVDFNFEAANRNLYEDFSESDCTLISRVEPMPVYLRIRPLNASESAKVLMPVDFKTVVLRPLENKASRAGSVTFGQASYEFVFSRVFDERSTQNDIFKVIVLDRVSEFLEGVNGLVFAYGTTSSGKTYSLQGTSGNAGIVPRALECVFRSAKLLRPPTFSSTDGQVERNDSEFLFAPHGFNEIEELSAKEAERRRREKTALLRFVGNRNNTSSASASSESNRTDSSSSTMWTSLSGSDCCGEVPFAFKETAVFAFWVSFVEIYNEVVYDLLDPEFVAAALKSCGPSQYRPFKLRRSALDLRTDKKGRVRWHAVNSAAEAMALLCIGRRCQAVSATRLNSTSSRSHAIFSLRALRVSSRGSANVDFRSASLGSCSELVFCDLAGSERICKAETDRNWSRLREANSINTSLLALGRCIAALRSLAGHQVQNRPGVIVHSTCYPVVPYRESRLTRLFANFFSPLGLGTTSSKACLLVNAAPSAELVEETLHALRFSALASQVILPQPGPPAPPPILPEHLEGSEEEGEPKIHSKIYFTDPDANPESVIDSTAMATAAIEKQLQAHLLRKGFHLRYSSCLNGRKTGGMSCVKASVSPIRAPSNGDSDAAVLAQREVSYPLDLNWMGDIESDLAGLSRKALISAIVEIISSLADSLPAEVEAARVEVNDRLTKTFGDELLRMEEQYESLLAKQEQDYEEKLLILESKQHRQRRRTLTPSVRRRPAKTRRIDDEECEETDAEDSEVNLDDDECPSCTRLAAENEELRMKLEEAKSDLAEQSEAMVALSEQRDALQVDLRRAQFLAQLSKTKLIPSGPQGSETNSIYPACETSPGVRRESPKKSMSSRSFPPLLSPAYRTSVEGSDPDMLPPTPVTVIPAEKRREGAKENILSLRTENQQLLSQLASLRVDLDKSNLASASQERENEPRSPKKEMVEKSEPLGMDGRSGAAQMDSFLGHEVEAERLEALAEVESRCSALSAELSEVRIAHNQAMAQLEELQKRLADYEAVKKQLEEAESRTKESKKKTLDAAAQTEDYNTSAEEEPHSCGEAVHEPRRAPPRRGRQGDKVLARKPRKYRGKKQESSELLIIEGSDLPQLEDSDAENALSKQLARNLTRIQTNSGAKESHLVTAEEESECIPVEHPKNRKRRGRRPAVRKRSTVAKAVPKDDQCTDAVRRLAPLSETTEFLNIDIDAVCLLDLSANDVLGNAGTVTRVSRCIFRSAKLLGQPASSSTGGQISIKSLVSVSLEFGGNGSSSTTFLGGDKDYMEATFALKEAAAFAFRIFFVTNQQ
ncbi:hypothetical protein Aperf_G00000101276 [Anoplocephala perfoliata]